ncbi:hypothetical protein [Achromobacter ruhlandii]|uniref:hypothetical protein n=1 Tax=Achromobacter ruhlandii TaxID=72557 RepID=UPI001EEE3CA1|nr:hypothetical protein [Achromobacter ruhlandii]MCZ8396214.1 hypothetical protein [Achromobacter ruhlandii]
MTALIQLVFDGALVTPKHQVSLRTLSKSMHYLQMATDRAYLDVKYEGVRKHARTPIRHYADADFYVGPAEVGSFKIRFTAAEGAKIVKRFIRAISDPYQTALENGEREFNVIGRQLDVRRNEIVQGGKKFPTYKEFAENPEDMDRTYGDKAIGNYVANMVTPIAKIDGALLRIEMKPDDKTPVTRYEFNPERAKAFKAALGKRRLGSPVIYRGLLRMLDRGHNQTSNFKAKIINTDNDKDIAMYVHSMDDYSALAPHIDGGPIRILACPILEYDSYDVVAGDIQFLKILDAE